MTATVLPVPPRDRTDAVAWAGRHLPGLYSGPLEASASFDGGQRAADVALTDFDVTGYAASRNEVHPPSARGASRLSPYIRHGLLTLQRVWEHVAAGPARDVTKFRFELLWQEYARHWYAAHGTKTRLGTRYRQIEPAAVDPWPGAMACVASALEELHASGWMVNQARMWLASQWAVRHDAPWRDGEDHFFRHLLDGSRAANRLGWQWTAGLSKQQAYGFSRQQVLRRAPDLCDRCELRDACPIADRPEAAARAERRQPAPAADPGPSHVERTRMPDVVWLTAESLGDADPALAAHPDLPAVFVFDAPLLASLQLSAKRLVFLAQTVADLAERRPIEVWLGKPADVIGRGAPAVTYAPVPGFRRISRVAALAEVHPWPWLRRPDDRPVTSFSAWHRRG